MASSPAEWPDSGMAPDWLTAMRRYLLFSAAGNLLWEIVQLPLYTVWRTANSAELMFDVAHCTAGDRVIAGTSLLAGLVLVGVANWPATKRLHVVACTILIGVGYTIYSEFLNTVILQTWTYSDLMPVVPGLGTGLAPLAQWVAVPLISLWVAGRESRGRVVWPVAGQPGQERRECPRPPLADMSSGLLAREQFSFCVQRGG
jgi:hypothetical protein